MTYAGPLLGSNKSNTRASHKHDIRMKLSPQLERLWDQTPFLGDRKFKIEMRPKYWRDTEQALRDWLANNFEIGNIGFVPLVTERLALHCSLNILFLRPGISGQIISGGDIDNRLKTLFDALRRPIDKQELAGATPESTGGRVYCLLEDDSLINNVSVETGDLLEPVDGNFDANKVRLVITVDVLPSSTSWDNIDFLSSP
ncbi:MAG: hypothetical protein R3E09_04010 [Novosphingobium sp.]